MDILSKHQIQHYWKRSQCPRTNIEPLDFSQHADTTGGWTTPQLKKTENTVAKGALQWTAMQKNTLCFVFAFYPNANWQNNYNSLTTGSNTDYFLTMYKTRTNIKTDFRRSLNVDRVSFYGTVWAERLYVHQLFSPFCNLFKFAIHFQIIWGKPMVISIAVLDYIRHSDWGFLDFSCQINILWSLFFGSSWTTVILARSLGLGWHFAHCKYLLQSLLHIFIHLALKRKVREFKSDILN